MELNPISRQYRIEQASPARRREAPAASRNPIQADRLSLSKAAVAYLERINEQAREEAAKRAKEEEEGSGSSELDAAASALDTTRKCMEIAARLMRGDKVPPQDEEYLMKNDPDGYKLVLALRRPKKDPKEWDSILDGEKEKSSESSDESREAAPSGDASGSGDSSSGGDASSNGGAL